MSPATTYTCPSCGSINSAVLHDTSLLICKKCHTAVFQDTPHGEKLPACKVPPDWSFLQIGSAGVYEGESFTIIGRIRLQLRNDYKNLWCGAVKNGKHLWIMESFASFAVFQSTWYKYDQKAKSLHAGKSIKLLDKVIIRGEYVEKCEGISWEGELGSWKYYHAGFYFIQGSDPAGATCVFIAEKGEDIQYLAGQKIPVEKLQLKNILAFDEWK